MAICLVGLGSNVGDRVGNLLHALDELRGQTGLKLIRVSSFIETAPVGGPAGQPNYFNAAALVETSLAPQALLAAFMAIERRLGRVRNESCGPRTIDLDLLLHGDRVLETPELTIPHPRLHERRFVLAPAAEIAGDMIHPRLDKSIEMLLADLPGPADELGLRVITSISQMQQQTRALRRAGRCVGLVPTMGALHEGHLSLVRIARQRADTVIVTIFVNPTQFDPSEDFAKYPRTLESDLQALSRAGCDLVFVPSRDEMYPAGNSTLVEPPAVSRPLEGLCRPGHFRGVATVVLKLFQIIPAHVACFGQKDYQQAQVIRHMVADLNVPIEIAVCPTVREPDGLAMSSRNRYLSPAERQQALALSRALAAADQLVRDGAEDAHSIVTEMRNILSAAGIERIDYVALADSESLAEVSRIMGPAVALIACFVGSTRLIDNHILGLHLFPA